MKTRIGIILLAFTGSSFALADGAKIFTDNKCNSCHSIDAAKIKVVIEEGAEKQARTPPDLSGAGKDGDAAQFTDWLLKKDKGKHKKLHMKKFKGSDEDLKVLTEWLASLKDGESPDELYQKKK